MYQINTVRTIFMFMKAVNVFAVYMKRSIVQYMRTFGVADKQSELSSTHRPKPI